MTEELTTWTCSVTHPSLMKTSLKWSKTSAVGLRLDGLWVNLMFFLWINLIFNDSIQSSTFSLFHRILMSMCFYVRFWCSAQMFCPLAYLWCKISRLRTPRTSLQSFSTNILTKSKTYKCKFRWYFQQKLICRHQNEPGIAVSRFAGGINVVTKCKHLYNLWITELKQEVVTWSRDQSTTFCGLRIFGTVRSSSSYYSSKMTTLTSSRFKTIYNKN